MRFRRSLGVLSLALLAGLVPLAAPPAARAGGLPWFGDRDEEALPPVALLAHRIDELEEALNETGTVVAKKPDVWGESRMTAHRQEVEDELVKRLDKFELLLNASISRSDAAFFANSLSIQAALGSATGLPDLPTSIPSPTQSTSLMIPYPDAESSDVVVSTTPGQMRIATRTGDDAEDLRFATAGIGLEPTIQLNQLKRYLDHLNALRRLNAGGDTADAPGYALNLVRIPVSVVPGGETRKGHGAEITITAETHLSPELLPTAFRTLVIQDLVDQLALPVLKLAEAQAWDAGARTAEAEHLRQVQHRVKCFMDRVIRLKAAHQLAGVMTEKFRDEVKSLLSEWLLIKGDLAGLGIFVEQAQGSENQDVVEAALNSLLTGDSNSSLPAANFSVPAANLPAPATEAGIEADYEALAIQAQANFQSVVVQLEAVTTSLEDALPPLQSSLQALNQAISAITVPIPSSSSSSRVARYAVPPSRLAEVFGEQELLTIAKAFDRFREQECAGVVHLSDARAYVGEELQAAYDFLNSPAGVSFWSCAPSLAQQLRGGKIPVEERFSVSGGGEAVVPSLAWAVLVESALLNERLNEDLKRVSGDPNCNCMYAGPYLFLGPDPPMEARQAFMDYVRCRWPIHVFALDPVAQQQNLADQFSMRRELQLSAAVAMASGSISASDAMQFTRQIAIEQETIALNDTAVAFAHGADTFGWRFYPRFQTAEIESNATVLFRDLLVGGPNRDHLLRDRKLEPGMRECVALVVMPSFVPHVRFDIRSNWFELTDPEDTEASMTETVALSRKFGEMQQLMEFCSLEAQNYRPGEIERLYARVEQLSDKMPLQTVYAQVPYENTAGGFELFSSGVTDLGPELIDFYGAPGVGKARPTELFLVGKNFSVHETKVFAGNSECCFDLLSRDVMKVSIPANVRTVVCRRQTVPGDDPCVKCRPTGPCGPDCYEAVEVHLATPYGVSGRLLIPMDPRERLPAEAAAAAASAAAAKKAVTDHEAAFHPLSYGWAPEKAEACLQVDSCGTPVGLCIHDDFLYLKQAAKTPLGATANLKFAAWVEAIGPEGPIADFSTVLGPLTVPVKQETAKIHQRASVSRISGTDETCFACELWEVLAKQPNLARKAVKLKITGYVQPACGTKDCAVPIKLTNSLTITIGRCPGGACVIGGCPTGGCPTCVTAVPADAAATAATQTAPQIINNPALSDVTALAIDSTAPPLPETYVGSVMAAPIDDAPALPVVEPSPTSPPPTVPAGVGPALVVPVAPVPVVGGEVPGRVVIPRLPPTLAIETRTSAPAPAPREAPSREGHRLFEIFQHGGK